jgi:WD40 repeat protein
VTDGATIATLAGHTDGVTDVAFVGADHIVTAGADGDVTRWEAASGARIGVIEHHLGPVVDMVVSPSGAIASASEDGVVAWHAADGQRRGIDLETARRIAISRDGEIVAITVGKEVVVWRPRSERVERLEGPRADITGVAISPDDRRVAASSGDATGRIWDLASGFQQAIVASPSVIDSIAFSPDGARVLITGANPAVWDARPDALVASFTIAGTVQSVGFGGGGDEVVATARIEGCAEAKTPCGTVKVWTIGGEVAFELSLPAAPNHAALSRDGTRVAISADDGVTLWDVASRSLVATPSGADAGATWVAFDPTGERLLSSHDTGEIRVWDARAGRRTRTLQHGKLVTQVAWSSDGRIGSCGGNQALVWDDGDTPRRYDLEASCARIAFDREGRLAVAAGPIARLWEPASNEPMWRLDNQYRIHEVAFAGAGLMVIGDERTLSIWDRTTKRALDSFRVSAVYGTFDIGLDRGLIAFGQDDDVHVVSLARRPSGEVERVIERLPMEMERGVPVVKSAQLAQ